METKKRRSRMRRQPAGRCLALTPRDLVIFELLERYRYLRSTYIHAFVGGASETRFKERLGDLYHEGGYLNRPGQQWETAHARYLPVVHENSERARDVLAAHGRLPGCGPHMPYGATGGGKQFLHSLMICEVLASIELETKERADLRFVAWPEILARAPEATASSRHPLRIPVAEPRSGRFGRAGARDGHVIPDAVFGLEYGAGGKKAYRFFALEADRGTMPVVRCSSLQSSLLAKIRLYSGLMSSGGVRAHLGLPNLLVLVVTRSDARLRHVMTAMGEEMESRQALLFKSVGAVEGAVGQGRPLRLLDQPWMRAGLPPLNISETGVAD